MLSCCALATTTASEKAAARAGRLTLSSVRRTCACPFYAPEANELRSVRALHQKLHTMCRNSLPGGRIDHSCVTIAVRDARSGKAPGNIRYIACRVAGDTWRRRAGRAAVSLMG